MTKGHSQDEAIFLLIAEVQEQSPFNRALRKVRGKEAAPLSAQAKREKNKARIQVAAKCYRRLERRGIRPITLSGLEDEVRRYAVEKKDPSLSITKGKLSKFTLKLIKVEADSLPY